MAEKLETGQVHEISDGNGGTKQARVTETTPHRVTVQMRARNRGRWGKPQEMSRHAFRTLKIVARLDREQRV